MNGTATGAPVTRYNHADNLGSTNITSDSPSNLAQAFTYAPYGSVIASQNSGTTTAARQWIGQFSDNSGLSYLNARYYQPAQGQFLSEDPIFLSSSQNVRDPQSLSAYSYSEDNPITKEDPLGKDAYGYTLFGANFEGGYLGYAGLHANIQLVCVRNPATGDSWIAGTFTFGVASGAFNSGQSYPDVGGVKTVIGAAAVLLRSFRRTSQRDGVARPVSYERVCAGLLRRRRPPPFRCRLFSIAFRARDVDTPNSGDVPALTFRLTLGRPERFAHSRDVAGFPGLRPKQRQSGARDPQLGISKSGDPYLQKLPAQCSHYILGHWGPDSALRRWGLGKAEGGKKASLRAIVAVARKLAVLLHRLWTTRAFYKPFPQRFRASGGVVTEHLNRYERNTGQAINIQRRVNPRRKAIPATCGVVTAAAAAIFASTGAVFQDASLLPLRSRKEI